MKIKCFVLALLVSAPVHAQVIGTPTCEADVAIIAKDQISITGTLNNATCPEYEGASVRIVNAMGDFSYQDITQMRVSVQTVSSMGPNGPVEGKQWETVSAQTGGLAVAEQDLPVISVETSE